MELTEVIAKVLGPVLLLRGISILIDRRHFLSLLDHLEDEAKTVSFSMFPIAMLMTAIAIAIFYHDTSSVAAILIHVILWGMIIKTSLLILFPTLVAKKARLVGQHGFIHVVWVMCLLVGGYFSWFGYMGSNLAKP